MNDGSSGAVIINDGVAVVCDDDDVVVVDKDGFTAPLLLHPNMPEMDLPSAAIPSLEYDLTIDDDDDDWLAEACSCFVMQYSRISVRLNAAMLKISDSARC